MNLADVTLVNNTGVDLCFLPVLEESMDLCSAFTDLGRIYFGGKALHTIKDLWSIFDEGRLLSYREPEVRLIRRFFREYAFKKSTGWEGGLAIAQLMDYTRFTASYWRKLVDAEKCHLFVCNSLATRAACIAVGGWQHAGAEVKIVFGRDGIQQSVRLPRGTPQSRNIGVIARGRRLPCGARLRPGECLTSANNKYHFLYSSSGSLELKDTQSGEMIWSSGTNHKEDLGSLVMQTDGHLVLSNQLGGELWRSAAEGGRNWGSHLSVTDEGGLTITNGLGKVIWSAKNP